jgi:hypothetical protein
VNFHGQRATVDTGDAELAGTVGEAGLAAETDVSSLTELAHGVL